MHLVLRDGCLGFDSPWDRELGGAQSRSVIVTILSEEYSYEASCFCTAVLIYVRFILFLVLRHMNSGCLIVKRYFRNIQMRRQEITFCMKGKGEVVPVLN